VARDRNRPQDLTCLKDDDDDDDDASGGGNGNA